MTEQSKEQAAKVGAYLSRGVTIEDPRKVMPKLLAEVKGWEAFWAGKEKDAITAAGEKSLAAQEYHQIRRFLKIFVTPRLNEVGELQPADQVRMLNLLTPFDTEGGLRDFMLHFFQITEGDGDDLIYDNRDAFERELYVLHDLYKVKKTQEVIDVIRASGGEFPSVMSPEDQRKTLDQLAIILSMMYAQALPSEHRERIRQDISPKYLTARELLKRRESGLLFLYPHVREKYDYRRFFFLIYFKNGLRTKVGTDEQEFKYNFAHFQTLKREFLINWLASSLKGNPRKMELYSQYKLHGKTIRQWVEAHPENEAEYLMQMPAPAFKDMVEQINEKLPQDQRVGFVTEAENFGLFHELKKQLKEAVKLVKAPIQTLRKIVEQEQPAAAEPKTEPPPPPPPEPEPPPPEPKWEVTLLKKGQIGNTFLQSTSAGYNAHLNAIKARLGDKYRSFADYTSKLLENTPESVTIRRRTPKHEWTMPYHLKYILPDEVKEYLLILGAEVKALQRGMTYTAKESYKFTPYFVLGAAQPEERLDAPTGERSVRGKVFSEFDSRSPQVGKFAMEMLEIVKEKIQRK